MAGDLPQVLYRYRSSGSSYFADELRRSIHDGHAFFNAIEIQNDPFDCNPRISKAPLAEVRNFYKKTGVGSVLSSRSVEEFAGAKNRRDRRVAKKDFKVNYRNTQISIDIIHDMVSAIRRDTKIICLSERWDSPLMWAHYAGAHSGYVIKYKVNWNVLDFLDEDPPLEIRYAVDRPEINTIDILSWLHGGNRYVEKKLSERSDAASEALMFTKSHDWSYEREWRIQKRFKGPGRYCYIPVLEPIEILLGINFPEELLKLVQDIANEKIPLKRLKMSSKAFSFEAT